MAEIELKNVSLAFDQPRTKSRNIVYENFDIEIEKGSFTFLLGPSGCGKSTFLNIINGLLTPTTADTIAVDGKDIRQHPDLTRKMGYVFQGPRLLPWKTLKENAEFGLKGLGVQPKEKWPELIEKYFEMAGLTAFMNHYPSQVSGGMQQRAAIVRAWVNEPEILLMDEPFSHLDEITAAELRRELVSQWSREEERRTIVFVTHNIAEAAQMGSDVVVLTPTPSRICYRREIDIPWPRSSTDEGVFAIEKELRQVFADRAGVRV
jgi:NitT/TauT family transport system ATP-binding protein